MVIRSMLAGAAITLGCAAYISVGGGVPGAIAFSIGLLLVLSRGYLLFTGRVCYVESTFESIKKIHEILLFNIAGAAVTAILIRLAKPEIIDNAADIFHKKMGEDIRVVLLGMLCNVLIFFAVDGYKRVEDIVGKYIIVMFCVVTFILCGFEHCIANFGYFFLGINGTFNAALGIIYLIGNILGNAIGGIAIYNLEKYARKKKRKMGEATAIPGADQEMVRREII